MSFLLMTIVFCGFSLLLALAVIGLITIMQLIGNEGGRTGLLEVDILDKGEK